MSVSLFDLGQRLRAATLAHPVARSAFAPVLPPSTRSPSRLPAAGDGALVRAADASGVTTGSGQDALAALAELGVSLGADYRTLVIADRDNLSRLVELARATDPAAAVRRRPRSCRLVGPAGRSPGHGRRAERADRLLRPLGARRAARRRTPARRLAPVARRSTADRAACSSWRRPSRTASAARPGGLQRGRPPLVGRLRRRGAPTRTRPGTGAGGTVAARRRSAWPPAATRPSCTRACAWAIHWWPRASPSAARS